MRPTTLNHVLLLRPESVRRLHIHVGFRRQLRQTDVLFCPCNPDSSAATGRRRRIERGPFGVRVFLHRVMPALNGGFLRSSKG